MVGRLFRKHRTTQEEEHHCLRVDAQQSRKSTQGLMHVLRRTLPRHGDAQELQMAQYNAPRKNSCPWAWPLVAEALNSHVHGKVRDAHSRAGTRMHALMCARMRAHTEMRACTSAAMLWCSPVAATALCGFARPPVPGARPVALAVFGRSRTLAHGGAGRARSGIHGLRTIDLQTAAE